MRFIDEKGKLFGIINLIDLLVILVLGLLIVGGVNRMRSRPIIVNEESKAYITYEVPDVKMMAVENIEKGDPLYHYDKDEFLGTIVEKTYEPFTELLEKDGEWINAQVPEKYTVIFKVESDVRNNPDVITVGGEQIRVGIQYRLKNKKIAFFASVMEVELLD